MKQQIKLTESELYSIIKEAATNLIKEYGDRQETREKMAKAAKRSVEKGDDSTYHNAINSLHKRNSSKSEMSDFQKKFEENIQKECGNVKNLEEEGEEEFNEQPTNNLAAESKKPTKITESQLFGIIRESVKSILSELDWRTIKSAQIKAASDANDSQKPLGFRKKRANQNSNFIQVVDAQMKKQYGLDNAEVQDAIRGKGSSYDGADRRTLKQMDKLNGDYFRFNTEDQKLQSNYKDGKWQ